MDRPSSQEYHRDNAAHRLGQYNAWDVKGVEAVDLVWVSKAHAENPAAHRVLPHSEPSIAILSRRNARGEITEIDLTVCGPYQRASFYRPDANEELIGVRLKPENAEHYFNISPYEYVGAPPVAAPRSLVASCRESLLAAEACDVKILIPILMDNLIFHAQGRNAKPTPEAFLAQRLRRTQGRSNLRNLIRETGVSERHLRRRFRDKFGVTPKEYARQLRLTGAALYAERMDKPDWASIAAAFGYHDQSHMINEFQTMVQMTPRMLHRERRALRDAV